MMTREIFKVDTNQKEEIINLTDHVETLIGNEVSGIVNVFVAHATAALILNEDEPKIRKDYLNHIEKLVPKDGNYEHNFHDDNAHAHVRAAFLGSSITIPVEKGKLIRGTWQEIMLVESDGPKTRNIVVTLIGE